VATWGELGVQAQADYLALLATLPLVEVRREPGLLAVHTGVDSSTENGVVGNRASAAIAEELVAWFAEREAPASWLAPAPEPGLDEVLLRTGCRPEQTGIDMGVRLDALPEVAVPAGIEVEPVTDEGGLDEWLELAAACGIVTEPSAREPRRELMLALGLDPGAPVVSYLARRAGRAVGIAQAFYPGESVALLHVAVAEGERRRGIGRALVLARVQEARRRGCVQAVLGPSADGAKLYEALGFETAPSPGDRCYYLPISPAGP
jgi:GNAT superfamily N-acetyltransferase